MRDDPRPVLLTSLASAALLDGKGDLELVRETRGAPMDWGGVYAQLVRLTGPWRLSLLVDGTRADLPQTQLRAETIAGLWRSYHRVGRIEVEQIVAPIADPPGVLRTLRLTVSPGAPGALTVLSRWSPYLLPVLIEGIRPLVYRVETKASSWRVRQREFGLSFRSSVLPSRLYLNRASWRGGKFEGPVETAASEHELSLPPGSTASISFLIHGGLERTLGETTSGDVVLGDPGAASLRAGADDSAWLVGRPVLRFPEDPGLEQAYALACRSLRQLYTSPGDGMVGLVAGYPWYSAIWCRDLAWMLPAVLWLGDFDWAQRSLDSVFRFQAHADIPILGGERGELPMQISPGPIFLYGTSDTTLYYPGLIDRWVRHSGEAAATPPWGSVVDQIVGWGLARTDPATGLLRNGGEASSIGAVRSSVARVRYGINSPDTTIWDSTDRRDHAIDVQVLWQEALETGARLLSGGANDPRKALWSSAATRVADSVRRSYGWDDEGYLFDSLNADGPVRKVRPNALRAVSAGWFEPSVARAIVRRAAQEDLTTPWGVRTLSSRQAGYDPQAYHDGQVWTIASAWAAEAAFAAGETDLALRHLRTIASRIVEEGGFANECYRGDRPEPFNSCFLLGFSVGPFLTVLFERFWGLRVDALHSRLEVRPNFPTPWSSASISGLSIGKGRVDLDWSPERLRVRWNAPTALTVVTRIGETAVTAESANDLPLR